MTRLCLAILDLLLLCLIATILCPRLEWCSYGVVLTVALSGRQRAADRTGCGEARGYARISTSPCAAAGVGIARYPRPPLIASLSGAAARHLIALIGSLGPALAGRGMDWLIPPSTPTGDETTAGWRARCTLAWGRRPPVHIRMRRPPRPPRALELRLVCVRRGDALVSGRRCDGSESRRPRAHGGRLANPPPATATPPPPQ